MKNEEENVIYTLDGVTVGYPQPNRVYICGRDVTDYRTWKEFEQIVTDQSNQIRSLEERLENAIVPKFKIGQKVWFISDPNFEAYRKIEQIEIEEISVSSCFIERGIMYSGGDWAGIGEDELFATREDAEKRLAELEGK